MVETRKSNSKIRIYSFFFCSKVWSIATLLSPTFLGIDSLIYLLKGKNKTTSFPTLTPNYKYSTVNKFNSLINLKNNKPIKYIIMIELRVIITNKLCKLPWYWNPLNLLKLYLKCIVSFVFILRADQKVTFNCCFAGGVGVASPLFTD